MSEIYKDERLEIYSERSAGKIALRLSFRNKDEIATVKRRLEEMEEKVTINQTISKNKEKRREFFKEMRNLKRRLHKLTNENKKHIHSLPFYNKIKALSPVDLLKITR